VYVVFNNRCQRLHGGWSPKFLHGSLRLAPGPKIKNNTTSKISTMPGKKLFTLFLKLSLQAEILLKSCCYILFDKSQLLSKIFKLLPWEAYKGIMQLSTLKIKSGASSAPLCQNVFFQFPTLEVFWKKGFKNYCFSYLMSRASDFQHFHILFHFGFI